MAINSILKKIIGEKLLAGAREIIDEIVTTKEEKVLLEIKMEELINQHTNSLIMAGVEDRKSARLRETEAIKGGSLNLTQNVLAYGAIVAFFGMTAYIVSFGIGEMNSEESFIIGNLTGLAGAIAKDIYGYYFGSSKEREMKDMPTNKSPTAATKSTRH